MAENNAQNASTGKPKLGGALWVAPAGTALPADSTTALPEAYVCLGYISDAGLTNSVSVDSESIYAWGGDEIIRDRTTRDESFNFSMVETNAEVMELVYGADNVTADAAAGTMVVMHNNLDLPEQVFVAEILLKNDGAKRIVVPSAKVDDVGDIVYVDGEAIEYEVTIAALPDSDGNTAYEYISGVDLGEATTRNMPAKAAKTEIKND